MRHRWTILFALPFLLGLTACDSSSSDGAPAPAEGDAPETGSAEAEGSAPAEGAGGDLAPLEIVGAGSIDEAQAKAFAEAAGAKVGETFSVQGADAAWFFSNAELKQTGLGAFWEKPWEEVAANEGNPLEGMIEFHKMLKERGIDLVLLPVPMKSSIYPEKVDTSFKPGEPYLLAPAFEELREAGVNLIDVEPAMRAYREANPEVKLYCEQDSHYSPQTCELLASLLAAEVTPKAWYADQTKRGDFGVGPETTLDITGDLVVGTPLQGQAPRETLKLRFAGKKHGDKVTPVPPSDDSPVLLLGDSHTRVFQEGASTGMHCQGAGLLDHLQAKLGMGIDLVGSNGSGSVQARIQLFQKASSNEGYWDGKEIVLWVFTVRELTQSTDKLRSIPLSRH